MDSRFDFKRISSPTADESTVDVTADIYQLSRKHGTATRPPFCKMTTDETLLHIFLVRRHVLDFLMLEKGTGEF